MADPIELSTQGAVIPWDQVDTVLDALRSAVLDATRGAAKAQREHTPELVKEFTDDGKAATDLINLLEAQVKAHQGATATEKGG